MDSFSFGPAKEGERAVNLAFRITNRSRIPQRLTLYDKR